MAGYVSSDNLQREVSKGYACLYSKTTNQNNTVFVGSFTDTDTGRTYYLRTTLKKTASKKNAGHDVCIINVKTYMNDNKGKSSYVH